MKLGKGSYENLITKELKTDIEYAELEGFVCKKEDIDSAESPNMFATHVSRLIQNRLSDEEMTMEERSKFVNRLINLLDTDSDELIEDSKQMLTAVLSDQEAARNRATGKEIIRPLTGFRTSNLFTGGQSKVPLNVELLRDIASADRISILVSFLRMSGVNLIFDALKEFCNDPNHKLRVITTTYCNATEAKAVERLSKLPNTEIRISYQTQIERLHAKSYIFERNSGFSTAYIGSSNLSKSAHTDGLEWNIRVTNVENPHIIKTALATFDIYWNSPNFEDFAIGGIEKLRKELLNEQSYANNNYEFLSRFSILPHQKQILDKLEIVRDNGVKRNLIVAATGTGKTAISAFDYKVFCNDKSHGDRILFMAHREEILKQARRTYQSVLIDSNFGEIWVGGYRPANGIDHLFISVQTFNSKYDDVFSKLSADYYDYIVIDEAHHLVADSYRSVLSHFTPKLLIGLTATPERMDGVSLLPDFDNQISAEIRLPAALEEGLLAPFQYLCISDNTDLTSEDLMQGNKYIATKLTDKLCNEERVSLIIDRLNYYLPDETACKALGFCSTKEHAQYMAQQFLNQGLKADYLTSDKSSERDKLNKQLANGEINYLFVVDIFNEGVDIPEVDTVLFLRPTESLTIFLQQLGRGLRLAPGKRQLTVFDFVAQLNAKYDFTSRFRSLVTKPHISVIDQLKYGFTFLPRGCSIHLEEMAQKVVLENIKAAIYNKNRLVRELRGYDHEPTIKEFINNNGQDVRLLYKGNNCWTSLKREAGFESCKYEGNDYTNTYTRGISRLIHANSVDYLRFVKRVMADPNNVSFANEKEKTFGVMLYYVLYNNVISHYNFENIQQAFAKLSEYAPFIREINELVDYLLENISNKTFAVNEGMPEALEQYGCYTRAEILTIFGKQTERKTTSSQTGLFAINELNTELFFVTLNKSDKDFSASTMYDDYIINENRFHWKSQNNESHEGRGSRFVNQKSNGKKFVLFVRENKTDGFGNTCPFYCFGLVDYICSRDNKPMGIDWQLHHPILPQFIQAI